MEEFDVFDWAGNYIGRAVPVGSSSEGLIITIGIFLLVFMVALFTAPLWIGRQIMQNGGWDKASSRTKVAFVLSFLPWVLVAMQPVVDELEHSNVCAGMEVQIQGNEILVKSRYRGPLHYFISVNGGEEEHSLLINTNFTHPKGQTHKYEEPVREVKLLRVFGYLGSPNKSFSEYCNQVFYP